LYYLHIKNIDDFHPNSISKSRHQQISPDSDPSPRPFQDKAPGAVETTKGNESNNPEMVSFWKFPKDSILEISEDSWILVDIFSSK